MLKNLKLGTKIGAGFGVIIFIAVILGSLSIWKMNGVYDVAEKLSTRDVPEVKIANDIERSFFSVLFEARGFAFTHDPEFALLTLKNIEATKNGVKTASAYGQKGSGSDFNKNVSLVDSKLKEYEAVFQKTVELAKSMNSNKTSANEAYSAFIKAIISYSADLDKTSKQELMSVGAKSQDSISARLLKLELVNGITESVRASRADLLNAIIIRKPALYEDVCVNLKAINKKFESIRTEGETDSKALENMKQLLHKYYENNEAYIKKWNECESYRTQRQNLGSEILSILKNVSVASMKDAVDSASSAGNTLSAASWTMVVGLCIAVLLGAILGFTITVGITAPIRKIIMWLNSSSSHTAVVSSELATASSQIAECAGNQAAAIEETSASLEEMNSMIKANMDNVSRATAFMNESKFAVNSGHEAVSRMQNAMNEISMASKETAKIVKTIDEIAFQTNLLALNAAVEAARAGEAGKGFAVVAEEVRALAQRSADAAKNTSAMIEETISKVAAGTTVASIAGDAFVKIVKSTESVAGIVTEIASATEEQSKGISQIGKAISSMDSVTQSNAANAEEMAASSEELSGQAAEMKSVVGQLSFIVAGAKSVGYATEIGEGKRIKSKDFKNANIAVPADNANSRGLSSSISKKGLKPSEIIPLDDKDLESF